MFGIQGTKQAGCLVASNEQDFKKIYNATMEVLFKVAYRIVDDDEVAEELVHDSLIKIHEKKMEFPSLDDAKFFLIRVVKNASLNYAKRKNKEKIVYEKVLHEDNRKIDSGETEFFKNDACERTRKALNMLPEHFKVVLILREYADLNYKEIGRILGITEGNVKVRIFRAREHLSKILGEEDVYLP